ncbi:MAG: CoA transferase [Chloroflexi bacterium]|nr:CoA transferase [Chloroflexota bacterium]
MPAVLSAITVVEVGEGAAVAFCGKLLADAGARVIKVEPPGGDALRRAGPRGPVDDPERSPLFLALNTNKQSVVIDLDAEPEALASLVARADVLIDALPPGRLVALGLGPDHLAERHPALVACSITPYGHAGPFRERPATELTMFATGGAMYREGLPHREPIRYAGQIPKTYPGLVAAGMVSAALLRRRSTGRGDWIDLAEVDCWASHPNQISRRLTYAYSGHDEAREDTKATATAASAGFGRGTYRCLDGYMTFLPLGDRHWPRLVEMLEQPALADDPRFATREARRDHRADWEEIWEAYLRIRPVAEVFAAAQRAGIPAAPLYDAAGVLSDPHLTERGYLREVAHPVAGTLRYAGPPAHADPAYWRLERAAPRLGEHTDAVLTEHSRRLTRRGGGAGNGRPRPLSEPLPLAGVRAIEVAEIWAGPYCGVLLGDLGAEVIKVEAIQRSARGAVHPLPGAPGYPKGDPGDEPWNRSAGFNAVNRNKRGVTLDLHSGRGQELLDRLLATADVVYTNLSFDAQESLNLLPERLLRANPRLVIALLTGFGLTGPYRYYRSMGMTLDAASGHSVLRGYPDLDLSTITPVHHPDAIGAATGLFMIGLGLERRAQTGQGQVIDLSQLEAAAAHLGEYLLDRQLSGEAVPRLANDHAWMAPHGCFAARDPDTWVTVAVDGDERFAALCRAIGRDELAADPRYASAAGRLQHRALLDDAVGRWVRERNRFEAEARLLAAGVPAAAVLRGDVDHVELEALYARGALERVDLRGHGRFPYPRAPWGFTRTEPLPLAPAPLLGEHNAEVLGGLLGLSADELRRLEQEQVIGARPLETADAPVPVRRR